MPATALGSNEMSGGTRQQASVVDWAVWRSWAFEPSQGVFCQMLHNDSKVGQCSLHPRADGANSVLQPCYTCPSVEYKETIL